MSWISLPAFWASLSGCSSLPPVLPKKWSWRGEGVGEGEWEEFREISCNPGTLLLRRKLPPDGSKSCKQASVSPENSWAPIASFHPRDFVDFITGVAERYRFSPRNCGRKGFVGRGDTSGGRGRILSSLAEKVRKRLKPSVCLRFSPLVQARHIYSPVMGISRVSDSQFLHISV